MNQNHVRQILADHRLAPSKQLGQNFLVQPQIAAQIVEAAGLTPGDTVVELGVGLGALTAPLAARAGRVIGLELDAGIVKYHREAQDLAANVQLLHQDLLKADFSAMAREQGQKLKIIANLPYSVTNPLLFKLLEHHPALEWAVLMIQKEVAERLTAKPNSKEYGVLTVLLGSCATVERLLLVGPGNFYPRPKVDSVVIRIRFIPPAGSEADPQLLPLLRRVVDTAFGQRRKTLLNSLGCGKLPGLGRIEAARALEAAAISPKLRAENLTTADYLRLTGIIADLIRKANV
ncbi:16S rRNA (adenine(1518)-N(6)/adenine(1519)-N(6))-dimethyltransferase RsmA [Desulfurivibrio sp. D14AmB]|uniref:16S rRNA (adenine(1518)-N(6)/adenine(1519)-N(6))- dimethyltransferase RsmA n=1 Tax=Desulfurivibrio sp. D14AmB TaxID=3374370 RepID=UPI00376F25C9